MREFCSWCKTQNHYETCDIIECAENTIQLLREGLDELRKFRDDVVTVERAVHSQSLGFDPYSTDGRECGYEEITRKFESDAATIRERSKP